MSSQEIIPQQIKDSDSIYLVVSVSFPHSPVGLVNYNVEDFGDSLLVECCYSNGWFTFPDSRIVPFNLGLKPTGVYNLKFEA